MARSIYSVFAVSFLAVVLGATSDEASAGSDSGIYVGASVGSSQLDYDDELADIGEVEFDDDDAGYKIFAGYNLGLIPLVDLAVEGAYVDFGNFSGKVGGAGGRDLDVTGWTGAGLAGFKLGPIGLFGKAGAINWDSDADVIGNRDGTDPFYGVGARLTLFSFQVRAEYERYDLDDFDIDYFSVGAAFTF